MATRATGMLGLALFAAMLSLLAAAGPALAACPALDEAAAAVNAGDEVAARAATSKSAGCSAEDQALVRRVAGLAAFNRIVAGVADGRPLASFETELSGLRTDYGAPWQVLDALADIARARKDYAAAARLYQSALEDAGNETLTPDWMAPPPDYLVRLDRLATEMRLAAPQPVQLAMRGGCRITYRGIAIRKKTTPVRYVFGTADFTPEGLESARNLSECLKSVQPSAITLTGHTDPIGSTADNQRLSEHRAEALAAYLVAEGYRGRVTTAGRGEDEPFVPDDASAYDEETLNQMHRRVDVDVEK
ncbi:OmpA family protein [Ensifer soli]|uniref:OmpA family protein n=1 Tax=Ciceribacter sp. sgz301302 TaxID=3342379 RepID=UPI0035BA40A7